MQPNSSNPKPARTYPARKHYPREDQNNPNQSFTARRAFGPATINAARAIGDMRKSGHAALPDLLAESQNPEIPIRTEVISALGSVVEKVDEVRPVLTAAAEDQNPKVRNAALSALHYLDPKHYPDAP